ncbi:hypothetical protein EV174_005280 [Coemansia sp. RSA 2320]|nr:hypothetical protein EV174_005280 [Coemansia sp. RSA 2320]
MLLRTILGTIIALAAAPLAVQGVTNPPGNGRGGRCPSRDRCYHDTIRPVCAPGRPCPMWVREVVACAWRCGDNDVPSGCTQRCKPCKAEVCAAVCECEIVCPAVGSCMAK